MAILFKKTILLGLLSTFCFQNIKAQEDIIKVKSAKTPFSWEAANVYF